MEDKPPAVGECVDTFGLRSDAAHHLNGHIGVVTRPLSESGLSDVKVAEGSVKIRAANICRIEGSEDQAGVVCEHGKRVISQEALCNGERQLQCLGARRSCALGEVAKRTPGGNTGFKRPLGNPCRPRWGEPVGNGRPRHEAHLQHDRSPRLRQEPSLSNQSVVHHVGAAVFFYGACCHIGAAGRLYQPGDNMPEEGARGWGEAVDAAEAAAASRLLLHPVVSVLVAFRHSVMMRGPMGVFVVPLVAQFAERMGKESPGAASGRTRNAMGLSQWLVVLSFALTFVSYGPELAVAAFLPWPSED